MLILGISAFYHTSAACILRDGSLVAAAAEERFTRIKFDPRLPIHSIRFCLQQAGVDVHNLDAIAYYEQPLAKLERQLAAKPVIHNIEDFDPKRPEHLIRDRLGYTGQLLCFPHHLSHAASAFHFSGFAEAAILTVDGVGEWDTTCAGYAQRNQIELNHSVRFPHSLGLFYATITQLLGFAVNADEYKVMGLAPYGQPRYLDRLKQLISSSPDSLDYALDMAYFDFSGNGALFTESLVEHLDLQPRQPESQIAQSHCDLAKSMQTLLEETLLEKVRFLHKQHPSDHLCMAGGVALNCVANGRILREGPFKKLFVQPAAGDDGTCLGAAALAHVKLTNQWQTSRLKHAYWGPGFSSAQVQHRLQQLQWSHQSFDDEDQLLEVVAKRILAGDVVGWFQGRAEFGPRALGARSILANPLLPDMRDRLNAKIKKREGFRPFAPAVLADAAKDHFADATSPFMLETCHVTSPLELPGVRHVDDSARPQVVDQHAHPRYRKLIQAFEKLSGCPMLVNTSFNVRGEPVVQTPDDALRCLANSGLDLLVIENIIVERSSVPPHLDALLPLAMQQPTSGLGNRRAGIRHDIYTFV